MVRYFPGHAILSEVRQGDAIKKILCRTEILERLRYSKKRRGNVFAITAALGLQQRPKGGETPTAFSWQFFSRTAAYHVSPILYKYEIRMYRLNRAKRPKEESCRLIS